MVGASFDCSTLRELHNLNLYGELELRGLENVSQEDAKAANLRNKEKLTHLSLVWDSECCVEEPNCHGKVLDALKPHHGLLMLNVISYKRTHFPAWMTDLSMLQNLVELKLEGCTMCEEFPQFIQFRSLQVLYLIRLDKLQTLCCEEGRQGKEAFYLLEKIVIESCPKFRTLVHDMASTMFPALKEIKLLDLEGLERFVATGERQENEPMFPLLEEVDIVLCPKLQTLCYEMASTAFPSLKKIKLYDLEGLERLVENESTFHLLEQADIGKCPNLRSLPEAPKLKIFTLNENKAELSLWLLQSRFMSSLSKLELNVDDKEGTMQLDQIQESSLSGLDLSHCNFFPMSPSQPIIMFWKWLGQLVHLCISDCDVLIYWPEEEFLCLVSLKTLCIICCDNLIGRPRLVKGEPTCCARDQLLPCLTSLLIWDCDSLRELFVLPPSLTDIEIAGCSNLEFIWGKRDTESESVQVEHHNTFTSSEHCNDRASRTLLEQSPSAANHHLPCLEFLNVTECRKMIALDNLPSSLKMLNIHLCPEINSLSGQLYELKVLIINSCNKLESLNRLGDLPSLETLDLQYCKRLTSLPCGLGSYSSLSSITIRYCPAMNTKPIYKCLQPRLDSLEIRDLSDARASDPQEGTSPLLFLLFHFRFSLTYYISICCNICTQNFNHRLLRFVAE